MINFGNCVLGFFLFIFGIVTVIYIIRTKKKTGEDIYSSSIKLGAAAIISILIGVDLFITEILRLIWLWDLALWWGDIDLLANKFINLFRK